MNQRKRAAQLARLSNAPQPKNQKRQASKPEAIEQRLEEIKQTLEDKEKDNAE